MREGGGRHHRILRYINSTFRCKNIFVVDGGYEN